MSLLTIPQAAERLSVSRRTVEREIADGRLRAIRVRGLLRVDPADLDAYIREQVHQCRSASVATDGRSESVSALVAGLSVPFLPVRVAPTRGRSKLRSVGSLSTRPSAVRAGD